MGTCTPTVVINPTDILTVPELAARLKVRPTWVYEHLRARDENPLPVIRVGKYLRFSWVNVCGWLQSRQTVGVPQKLAGKRKGAR
jgi:predicted DNA-binding transcriptional regulator AlpA